MGRPPKLAADAATLAIFHRAGRLMVTKRELAFLLNVSQPTIYKFFDDHPEAVFEFERGQALTCIEIRRAQFALAEAGNVRMLIWLGKVYLGQGNQPDPSATIDVDWSAVSKSLAAKLELALAA